MTLLESSTSTAAAASDPFFTLIPDSEWNACIGKQGTEENYVDGFMEAAVELAGAVVDKRQHGKRDTLSMPTLYNARHALELSLKFAIDRLVEAKVLKQPHEKNHDIKSHYDLIDGANLGDVALRQMVEALRPYVESLHGIDQDGQQLRYAETQDGRKSLEDKAICNLVVIRDSLVRLNAVLLEIKYRATELADERASGTFTKDLSRRDLKQLAEMLPPRDQWATDDFTAAKDAAMARFGIGGGKFSDALDVIKGHREMAGRLGVEFELAHLSDAHARLVLEEWSKANPPQAAATTDLGFDVFKADRTEMYAQVAAGNAALKAVIAALPPEELADLEVIFYIGRERLGCEEYAPRLASTLRGYTVQKDLWEKAHHIFSKANLPRTVIRGLEILGRRRLASELRAMRADFAA